MRDCFAGLHLGNTVIHGAAKMARKLSELTRRDQGTNGHQAAISRVKVRAKPKVSKQNIRCVLHQPRKP